MFFAIMRMASALQQRRRQPKPLNPLQGRCEQLTSPGNFGHMKRHVLGIPNDFRPTAYNSTHGRIDAQAISVVGVFGNRRAQQRRAACATTVTSQFSGCRVSSLPDSAGIE
jgi:hypothetical protein